MNRGRLGAILLLGAVAGGLVLAALPSGADTLSGFSATQDPYRARPYPPPASPYPPPYPVPPYPAPKTPPPYPPGHPPADEPAWQWNPFPFPIPFPDPATKEMLLEGADKLLRAIERMIETVPRYDPPVMTPEGDIIIRRRPTPVPPPAPPQSKPAPDLPGAPPVPPPLPELERTRI